MDSRAIGRGRAHRAHIHKRRGAREAERHDRCPVETRRRPGYFPGRPAGRKRLYQTLNFEKNAVGKISAVIPGLNQICRYSP